MLALCAEQLVFGYDNSLYKLACTVFPSFLPKIEGKPAIFKLNKERRKWERFSNETGADQIALDYRNILYALKDGILYKKREGRPWEKEYTPIGVVSVKTGPAQNQLFVLAGEKTSMGYPLFQKIGLNWVEVFPAAIDFSVGKDGQLFIIKGDGEVVLTKCYTHMQTLLSTRKAFWKTK